MEVLSRCGHAVHEDLPDKVSSEYNMYHCMIMLSSIIAITELKMEFNISTKLIGVFHCNPCMIVM